MDVKELAKQYFKSYPNEEVLYISTDGQVFLQANHHEAADHQRKIDEKTTLQMVRRKDVIVPVELSVDEGSEDEEQEEEGAQPEPDGEVTAEPEGEGVEEPAKKKAKKNGKK